MTTTTAHPVRAEPATSRLDLNETEVGSVFVSNYPPYSFWSEEALPAAKRALNSAPSRSNSLGLYLHIPFCRKRCKFCYFRVYTDKNASQIKAYLDALAREVEVYSELPAVANRPLQFVYFGGGTPSYISVRHLKTLARRLKTAMSWDSAQEVAFECEPGTLSQPKLEAIREVGITRLSLGVENLDDFILKENGRAHLSKEIYDVMPWITELEFGQLNIDLIAGMVGETWTTWRANVEKTIDLNPDSITIYQMELPFNTVYTELLSAGKDNVHIADWQTKRDWHQYAFEQFAAAGYRVSSAYTMVKKDKECEFVYRDSVWQGTDMIGAGVASFGHMKDFHVQNSTAWDPYIATLKENNLPLKRAYKTTKEERLTREVLLQLKLGRITTDYFEKKFSVNIIEKFIAPLCKLRDEGMLTFNNGEVCLTQPGFLRVDQLLPEFYAPQHRNSRYT